MGRGIEEIFAEAIAVPTGELTRFLEQRCEGNPTLIADVRSLVESYRASESFLERPVGEVAAEWAAPEVDEWVGRQVGEFHLIRQLGEGGCGRVYLAEQVGAVRRKVAVKIVRPGFSTPEMLARFRIERQVLVSLEHANIAKLFAAGQTEQGFPYFAMEYVDGLPLTKHCEQFALTMDQRLKVFLDVCSAVQHMHGRGIIHRDLKPSNVLVGEADGVPKVIDFGIAKSSDDPIATRSLATRVGSPIGTLEYMSPEQLSGKTGDVDNRTDVYALGVILYELLTGSRPFEVSRLGFTGAIKWICDHEPLRASTRVLRLANAGTPPVSYKELKGDLDWILLKAIARDKNRRYTTVQELAADVQRFRNRQPVLARPDSTAYRVQKFIARNRAVSILGVATVFALVIATVVGFVAAGIARSAEASANAAALRNSQLAYRSSITAAAANAQRDPAAAKRAISDAPSEQRDWEWHFLNASIDQAAEFHNDERQMSALAASRDGRWIAIGLHDGEILLWKRGVAKPRELAGHGRRIQSLKFNPDGSLLVSAGSDGEVRLWQAEGGESTLLGKHNTGVAAVAFDGHRVASGDAKGLIRLWSVDGQPLGEVSGSVSVSSLALANEQVVAGLGDGTVRLADTSTGQIVREWRAASGSIRCLLVAGETSEVITGSLTGSAARWDIATGRLLHTFAEPGHPGFRSFDLSPDERLIAAGDRDGDITVWDRLTGERVGRLAGRTGPIEGVGFVGSSTEVASASWNGAARGWTIGFGHAQRHFVSDVGRPVRLWFESGAAVVAAVSSSGRVGRWNSATGERIDSWDLGGSAALSVAPNERFAAFAVDDQIVHVVDLSKRTLAASVPTSERAIATAVAGDGNHVAYGCESGLVEIRVCEDGRGRHTSAAAAGCTALAASPDGCFIAAGFRDGSARIFDLRQRQVRVIGLDAWSSPVLAISFSPDSRVIAFGLHENSVATLHLVHAETGVVFRSCGGGGAGVDTLTFSPTGRRLASSGERRSLRVWGVDDGQEILVLQGLDSQISALAFSRDGLSLAASTGAGSVNVYSGSMPQWWWIQAATDR